MGFEEAIHLAKELGVGVELQLDVPNFWFSDEQIQGLRAMCKDVPLILHAPYRHIHLATVMEEVRRASVELINKTVGLAKELGASLIVIHAGNVGSKEPRDLALEMFQKSWEELKRDVPIALENVLYGGLFTDPADFFEVNVPICLDVAHAYASGNLDAFLDLFGERIVAYHLSDTIRGRDLHLPLGKGEILWKSVLEQLDPEKPWIIEVPGREGILQSLQLITSLI